MAPLAVMENLRLSAPDSDHFKYWLELVLSSSGSVAV